MPAPVAGAGIDVCDLELTCGSGTGAGRGSDRQAAAALRTATREDLAAIGGLHAGTETVVALALQIAGLVSALGRHGGPAYFSAEKIRKDNGERIPGQPTRCPHLMTWVPARRRWPPTMGGGTLPVPRFIHRRPCRRRWRRRPRNPESTARHGCLAPLPATPGSRTATGGRAHLAEAPAGRSPRPAAGAVCAERIRDGGSAQPLPAADPRAGRAFRRCRGQPGHRCDAPGRTRGAGNRNRRARGGRERTVPGQRRPALHIRQLRPTTRCCCTAAPASARPT